MSPVIATSPFLDGVRPEIRSLPRYNAGLSSEFVRATYHVEKVAKLGSNENPYGPSPRVIGALQAAAPNAALYPDPSCAELRASLAENLEVAPDRLAFGNGSEDLIAISIHAFLSAGEELVTFAPSFGLHVLVPQSIGARAHAIPVRPDYRMNMQDVLAAITPRTRMVMFGNPSNPVGSSITGEDMKRLLATVQEGTLIVFDEAYFEYAAADPSYAPFLEMLEKSHLPWLALRTFSKAYGLAGLRIGYGIASDPALIDLMDRVRGAFNVNRLAQTAAVAALEDPEWMHRCVAHTIEERERTRSALVALGYRPAPSLTNFLFFDAGEDASELAGRLLRHGVIVKPWREPGYTQHIRVSTGSPEANDQFLDALKKEKR